MILYPGNECAQVCALTEVGVSFHQGVFMREASGSSRREVSIFFIVSPLVAGPVPWNALLSKGKASLICLTYCLPVYWKIKITRGIPKGNYRPLQNKTSLHTCSLSPILGVWIPGSFPFMC